MAWIFLGAALMGRSASGTIKPFRNRRPIRRRSGAGNGNSLLPERLVPDEAWKPPGSSYRQSGNRSAPSAGRRMTQTVWGARGVEAGRRSPVRFPVSSGPVIVDRFPVSARLGAPGSPAGFRCGSDFAVDDGWQADYDGRTTDEVPARCRWKPRQLPGARAVGGAVIHRQPTPPGPQ